MMFISEKTLEKKITMTEGKCSPELIIAMLIEARALKPIEGVEPADGIEQPPLSPQT